MWPWHRSAWTPGLHDRRTSLWTSLFQPTSLSSTDLIMVAAVVVTDLEMGHAQSENTRRRSSSVYSDKWCQPATLAFVWDLWGRSVDLRFACTPKQFPRRLFRTHKAASERLEPWEGGSADVCLRDTLIITPRQKWDQIVPITELKILK